MNVVLPASNTSQWVNLNFQVVDQSDAFIVWEAVSKSKDGKFVMTVNGELQYDGFIDFCVTIESTESVEIENIELTVPVVSSVAKYLMGLNEERQTDKKERNTERDSRERDRERQKVCVCEREKNIQHVSTYAHMHKYTRMCKEYSSCVRK